MNVNKHEHLSALIDDEAGEFEGRRLLDELCKSAEDRALWGRYHLIGEAMRAALPERVDLGFADRISRALEAEPLPGSAVPAAVSVAHRLTKPVIGFALAAGVAVVSVVSLQSFTQEPGGDAPARLAEVGGPPVITRVAVEAPLPSDATVVRVVAGTAAQPLPAPSEEAAARLNSYLVNHAEYAPSRPGMLPQVRVVGYGQNQD